MALIIQKDGTPWQPGGEDSTAFRFRTDVDGLRFYGAVDFADDDMEFAGDWTFTVHAVNVEEAEIPDAAVPALARAYDEQITNAACDAVAEVRAWRGRKVAAETVSDLESAARLIIAARDHCAEHGVMPPWPLGPGVGQGFDDWAADVLSRALVNR